MKQRKSGFTLIELLVVIAVIAILASILFPVFASARDKARQVICMNNDKQLITGILMYNQDYNDRWMDACSGYNAGLTLNEECINKSGVDLPHWIIPKNYPTPIDKQAYLLKPYLRNQQVMYCPVIRKERISDEFWPNYAFNELRFNGSQSPYATTGKNVYKPPDYFVSNNVKHWQFIGPFGRLQAQLNSPANLIAIWEHNNAAVLCNTWGPSDKTHWASRHTDGFLAAFADGHAKRYTLKRLSNQIVFYWQTP